MTKKINIPDPCFLTPDPSLPLLDHLIELRQRLLWVALVFIGLFGISYYYSSSILNFLLQPLADVFETHGLHRRLIYTHLLSGFTTHLKTATFTASFFSLPILLIQGWRFIAPGLLNNERPLLRGLFLSTPLLFIIGALFAYYGVFPKAYSFFLTFEQPATASVLAIQLEARVDEYLSFVIHLVLGFGICFELPILLILLMRGGIIDHKTLIRQWRIAVVAIFTLSAIITPPDIFSMIALAIPLLLLYGGTVLVMKVLIGKH